MPRITAVKMRHTAAPTWAVFSADGSTGAGREIGSVVERSETRDRVDRSSFTARHAVLGLTRAFTRHGSAVAFLEGVETGRRLTIAATRGKGA